MDNNKEPSKEELEALIEKAKKELQERLDKMTPEEREQAKLRYEQAKAEDEAKLRDLTETAAKFASGAAPAKAPKFCPNCGARAGGGKFCEYCGSKLRD